ncbi:flagellin [Lysinibacillus sp. BW-2-10]|uniref:flagellin n=1 Tax=Lysinibacillus sp. BW-2-10 TaxID=2590030 RepID=UPI00117F36FC|nr:flagellin [Lysinibacillus sp. BW-2-10]TSI04300.1 hypothetical protein FJQ64_15260 [Lysinibacillus sp. BW-2-10]
MKIRHNIPALNTLNKLQKSNKKQSNSMKSLSSGLRINVSADDAAGLAISEKMRGQIRGLAQAQKNIQDGISLIQTAESGLSKISNPNLMRLRELAVKSANDTLTDNDRALIQKEVNQIIKGIDDIAHNTEFNSIKVLELPAPTVITETTTIKVTVAPGQSLVAGFINIPTSNTTPLEVEAMFGTISGADWPDMNIISPTGRVFGFGGTLSGGGSIGATDSASSATYNGWSASNEKMTFNDPVSGLWRIEIRNTGGSSGSTFDLKSNFGIQSTAPTATTTYTILNDHLNFHTGANSSNRVRMKITDARTEALGIHDLSLETRPNAELAILKIDHAIAKVSSERSKYGAYQNKLEHLQSNLSNSEINLTASESLIRDVDMARAMMDQTKESILGQASQAMLAQANQIPQNVLQLIS